MEKILPYFSRGVVVKGFGRGSKQLGIPTGIKIINTVNGAENSLNVVKAVAPMSTRKTVPPEHRTRDRLTA